MRRLMRNADRSIGRAVTLAVALLGRLMAHFRRHLPAGAGGPRHILVIKLVGLGDTVLMLTPLRKIRDAFPEARICALVTPLSDGILEGQPQIDEMVVYDVLGGDRGPLGFLRLIRRLRKQGFDCVVDFEQHFQMSAVIAYMAGVPRRIGLYYRGNPRRFLLTDPVYLDPDRHMVDTYMDLVTPLGIPAEHVEVLEPVRIGPPDVDEVERWLAHRRRHPQAPLVGIHAGSGIRTPERRWPRENFAEIIRRISTEYGADIVLTGGEHETGLVNDILRTAGVDDAHTAAGRFSIRQTAALMGMCDLFISNDTGPMHIAASVGTPTIGLFGPNVPHRYAPVGKKTLSIFKGVECSPCVHIHEGRAGACGRGICMEAISVDEVWDAIRSYDLKRAAV
jgi:heptosyltransferase-2